MFFLNIFIQSMMQRKQIYDRNVFNYISEVGNEIQAEIVLSPQTENENLQPWSSMVRVNHAI